MKVALGILALVTTMELVLGVPVYGPPQPLPIPQKYRSPNGAPIPTKYPPHFSGHSGKNEFYSKFNPHSLPPGLRGPAPQQPPPFAKYPNLPPLGKHQQQYQQQNQQQHPLQQHQLHLHSQQQQQKHQQQPHHPQVNNRPLGPQFQSKPHLLQNGAPHHPSQQGQVNNNPEQRIQLVPSRPTSKITNVWTGPKVSESPEFPTRFPAAATHIAPVTTVPFLEKPRGPYIINSDDERGPIKTIPAPNLNPADKPADFEEQLYRAQHQQSYVQPLDNSITDEKLSYQVTEDPNVYKQFSGKPSYKEPSNTDSNTVPAVPLDIALQQHLDNQHQQQVSAEQVGSTGTLTPQELYSLLNGNPSDATAGTVVPQTAYMVQQPVMYAIPQPQHLDLQVGHQLQYQAQPVQLQYAQQPAATGVQLQYAQPTASDLQYLQPQTVQYQPQAVQYQPQAVQYHVQPEHLQQQYQQQSAEQYNGAQTTAAEISAQKQQQQQELMLQQQEQQQQQQEQQLLQEQQQREQLKQQQQADQQQQQQQQLQQQQQQQQQLQQQQQPENEVQYQQEQDDYEPRNNGDKGSAEQPSVADGDQKKLQSIRDQYYSAVPNEQTASVLTQIAQSAANSDAPAADEPKSAEKSPSDQSVQMHTSVQIQQSVPLYEATYASSRRTNQEYADEDAGADELMEGSESVAVSESSPSSPSSVNGHAPSQFPYSAANINAFAAN